MSAGQAFVSDTFTGVSGTDLESHTGEIGATWAQQPFSNHVHLQISDANRARIANAEASFGQVLASGLPDSAEYDVRADVVVKSMGSTDSIGIVARADAAGPSPTYYIAALTQSGNTWDLVKSVAGSFSTLASVAAGVSAGETHSLLLSMRSQQKSVYVDGQLRIGTVDDSITAAGQVGIGLGGSGTASDSTGVHLDNFVATNPANPSLRVGLWRRRGRHPSVSSPGGYF